LIDHSNRTSQAKDALGAGKLARQHNIYIQSFNIGQQTHNNNNYKIIIKQQYTKCVQQWQRHQAVALTLRVTHRFVYRRPERRRRFLFWRRLEIWFF
jgi:hypothetical protein